MRKSGETSNAGPDLTFKTEEQQSGRGEGGKNKIKLWIKDAVQ